MCVCAKSSSVYQMDTAAHCDVFRRPILHRAWLVACGLAHCSAWKSLMKQLVSGSVGGLLQGQLLC